MKLDEIIAQERIKESDGTLITHIDKIRKGKYTYRDEIIDNTLRAIQQLSYIRLWLKDEKMCVEGVQYQMRILRDYIDEIESIWTSEETKEER